MSVDQLLKNKKLHMEQLMQDDRVRRLVAHAADHAYFQGHWKRDPPPVTCKKCEELLLELFPQDIGKYIG